MNRRFTWNLATLAIGATLAISASAQARDGAEVEVIQDDAQGTILQYEFAVPTLKAVRTADGQAVVVRLGDESINAPAGEPAIADVRRSISIDASADMGVSMIAGDFYEIQDVDVAPSKGPIKRTVNPSDVPYTFGPVYDINGFYPANVVEVSDPYILRSQRGVVVDVNPLQYNPVTRTLRVYRNMTVRVSPTGLQGQNILSQADQSKVSGSAFHAIYENQFLNYQRDLRYDPIASEGDLLVICHDAWMEEMQPFVDHKNGIGIATMMVGISEIGNSSTSIMSYIESMYANSDLVYILLVGDVAQIASPTVPLENGRSDPSYSLMTADTYPDTIIGRFSAESAADVATQVERVLTFENDNWTQDPNYKRAIGIGSAEGSGIGDDGESDPVHLGYIMDDLDAHGYSSTGLIVDPSGTVAQGVAALEAGLGTIAYCGHGSATCFGNGSTICVSDINALTNTAMMPWIISVACVNGQFDAGTCFAEAWLRANSGGIPTGAMAIYASSVNQYWAEPMSAEDEVYDLFTAETYATYGALCFAGSCLMMDEYGTSGVDMYETWHIFGDPTLRIVGTTAPPEGMQVTGNGFAAEGPNGGPFNPNTTTFTVKNYDATPLEFDTSVDVSWLSVVNGSGTLDQDEEAVITVSINSAANSLGNGFYSGGVSISGNNGENSSKGVDLTVGTPVAVYSYDLATNPGWTMEGEWNWGQPSGNGGNSYGNPDPSSGADGSSNVCGINLNGDYSSSAGGPYNMTTTAIDCSDLTDTGLKFQRWLNQDYQPYATATVEISNNGLSWTSLWNNGSSEVADSSWSLQEFDISAVADGQPTVYIRWTHAVTSGAWVYSGWNVSNVEIWGVAPETNDCPADLDGDGTIGVNDVLQLIGAWGTSEGDVTGDGTTDVSDILAILDAYGEDC
jgi:hypothetical protein